MARGRSTKLLTTLPDSYSADWLQRLDKRTKVARAVRARIAELETDAGGADSLSAARRSLIRHAAWLDAIVETFEMRLGSGEQIDVGAHTQSLNSLLGLYRLLGLERKARRTETLADVMGWNDPDPARSATVEPESDAEPVQDLEAEAAPAEAAPAEPVIEDAP